ncbi:hypothetical protein A5N15_03080 [Rothia kristinae]|uniref:DNA2/NAM7 helicase-like C-terminal domain-containing protein n=1 Tax=Rothia kristinae TaxID=37923 RepID=A0A657IVX1_9MICC|nr:hypothetical protein A5N15_03080 [Rothia kristinae]
MQVARTLVGRPWTPGTGRAPRPLEASDLLVVAAYNAQVEAIRHALGAAGLTGEDDGVRVGTVDKFQGQEAAVAIVSMAASSAAEVPRGMDFLLSPNRLNVAVSRGQWAAVLISSPALTDYWPASRRVWRCSAGSRGCAVGPCPGGSPPDLRWTVGTRIGRETEVRRMSRDDAAAAEDAARPPVIRPSFRARTPFLLHFDDQTVALGDAHLLQQIEANLLVADRAPRTTFWDQAYLSGEEGALFAPDPDPEHINSVGITGGAEEFWAAMDAAVFQQTEWPREETATVWFPEYPAWLRETTSWTYDPICADGSGGSRGLGAHAQHPR